MHSGHWAPDQSSVMPMIPDPLHVSFKTRSRHLLIDSRHRRNKDTNSNYRVFFGVRDEDGTTIGETIKNVISINVISAEIPRTADNIIDGRNFLRIELLGATHTVTVACGLYLTETAITTAIVDALNNLRGSDGSLLTDADLQPVHFDVDQTSQNRMRIYCSHEFSVIVDDGSDVEKCLAYQLGFVTVSASPAEAVANDDTGPVDSGTFPYMLEALRFTNLMPRPYVDVSIPEVPRIGTKLTNNTGSRVVARIPLGSMPGGSQHYEPHTAQLIRSTFNPITLTSLTIQLSGSDGVPYDSRDTPHTLSLELLYLADPLVEQPAKPVPQTPSSIIVVEDEKSRVHHWLARHKFSIALFASGAIVTLYVIGRLRKIAHFASMRHTFGGSSLRVGI